MRSCWLRAKHTHLQNVCRCVNKHIDACMHIRTFNNVYVCILMYSAISIDVIALAPQVLPGGRPLWGVRGSTRRPGISHGALQPNPPIPIRVCPSCSSKNGALVRDLYYYLNPSCRDPHRNPQSRNLARARPFQKCGIPSDIEELSSLPLTWP